MSVLLLPIVFLYRIPFFIMHSMAILKIHAATPESLYENTTPLYFLKELTLCIVNIFFTPINDNPTVKYIALVHVATHVATGVMSFINQNYLIQRGLAARKQTDLTFEFGLLYDTFSHGLVLAATAYYMVQAGLSVYIVLLLVGMGILLTIYQEQKAAVNRESDKDE
jgi:hypothetical protein